MSCSQGNGIIPDSIGYYILWFLIFAVITYLFLYSIKPSFVSNPDTGVVDAGKILLYSIIISLIIVFIIWLIKRSAGY